MEHPKPPERMEPILCADMYSYVITINLLRLN